MKKILIAVDNGPSAEKIAKAGFGLGKQLHAEIALVSIVDTTNMMTEGGTTPRELADLIIKDFKKCHDLLIEQVFKDFKIWTFVEEGKPFEMILKVADEWGADLIILGTHGRKGLSHFLIGSVAEKVIRNSQKPVLIVPPSAEVI